MSENTDGQLIERAGQPWVSTVTRDAVRHFAWGIGDDNRLWLDPQHANASCWGGLIAPPCFLYAVDETTVTWGLESHRRIYRSVDWVWLDVARLHTGLHATAKLTGQSDDGGVMEQFGRVEFHDEGGELIASAETRCERSTATPVAAEDRPEVRYTPDQLDEIERTILSEERRGSELRHWEEVAMGDQLGLLLKGPLSIMDVVAWCAGTQGVASKADQFGEGGLDAQTATGPQQVAWIAQLVTDWMGDDAFLHRLKVDIAANPPLGSTTAISGRIVDRAEHIGASLVGIELVAVSQDGEVSASGRALVVLPSRGCARVSLPLERALAEF